MPEPPRWFRATRADGGRRKEKQYTLNVRRRAFGKQQLDLPRVWTTQQFHDVVIFINTVEIVIARLDNGVTVLGQFQVSH
jgi:hypothetical protein